jgi:predicted DNA-binding helix-hairpin-helix protein
MSDLEKLQQLTSQMHLELTGEPPAGVDLPRRKEAIAVSTALKPDGKRIRLLKSLLSSYCENDCKYCPFNTALDIPRTAFSPDRFARLFYQLYKTGFVEGIFLSSGVFQDAIKTQDQLIATARILRQRYDYQGYLHLKIMPGAEQAQIEESMLVADRVSINMEAPTPNALQFLAPGKNLQNDLLSPLRWMREIRKNLNSSKAWRQSWPSLTTQFVVGAHSETDRDYLSVSQTLLHDFGLSRVYYSSFKPIPGTPLEERPPSSPDRERRLYQASFLLRDYEFKIDELPFNKDGNLPLHHNPKLIWAEKWLTGNPVEINTADLGTLLRVPGIGPIKAKRILYTRKNSPLNSPADLRRIGAFSSQSLSYILLNGRSPARQIPLL